MLRTIDCFEQVDILIGNDSYWCFLTRDLKWGEFDPVTKKTTLGWVFSGPLPQELSSESEVNLSTRHVESLQHYSRREKRRLASGRNEEILGVRECWHGIKRSMCT
ncbi:hypothetical protein P5673_024432 [Acropora cervicornis]|uniref:Uncharacterized protein n=1 Tax=Acropora cervicornis TaxID=6130 RepID=A0AAD9UY17_ACRCE|nr:hypothetical protein P5673_024432 [Acropora cervicornis]